MLGWGWWALALGLLLRLLAASAHEVPRGDVTLDVGVARSLAGGAGFHAGFERGVALATGAEAVPRQDLADQHPPLWPLLGAAFSPLAGSAFGGLQLGSFLAGLLLLVLVGRVAERLVEGIPGVPDGIAPLAAGSVAVSFLAIDASGNGSLYMPQAAAVLLLVEALAAARTSALRIGLVLGVLLLLNHQSLVLLPVPLIVLLLGARPGERVRAARTGLLSCALALLAQAPWWIRNALVFGAPLHSTNGFYFLAQAGVPWTFAIEEGQPVLRFAHGLDVATLLSGVPRFLPSNALYLFVAGLVVLPGVLGIALAAAPSLARVAVLGRERRLLALLACLVLLGSVALAWPAAKLRYLVCLQPLVSLLGLRAAATRPDRAQRVLGALVVLGWLAALLLTRDDLLSAGPGSRPERWWLLALGGAFLFVLPLGLHRQGWLRAAPRLAWLSGLPAAVLLAAIVAFGPGPGTAYHATPFLDDYFGQAKEEEEARLARALAWALGELERQGARSVAGPVDLLADPPGRLVSLPADSANLLEQALPALIRRHALDAVVLGLSATTELAGGEPIPGTRLLDGALQVSDWCRVGGGGVVLCRSVLP